MPKITFIEHNGKQHDVHEQVGRSLMQAAVDHLVPGIVADCGGSCSCATCHGYVDTAWVDRVPPADLGEQSMLECVIDGAVNSRLTCQIKITPAMDGLIVRLPKTQF
ncbi:2Fe-2S iron-sulfur cluster-binding protein [Scleromatobacter humisilvae]|jgi:2Fe-2S ferredoxin|uniref:2Fe-2S iron-sulfur cluster-binding protein n=1 Tax=Scleromatobacter humisilvae TaxID=2897159 RepID=A0A9X2C255_9BURK|nr:2Fe-2S iron-sulfur cluster-binding protein [Scleromatobacter humisilvae]MCK9685670.1 2Fe-2S iron-sulfur cluster-binding protein [Scleromatobacter humisilvae]